MIKIRCVSAHPPMCHGVNGASLSEPSEVAASARGVESTDFWTLRRGDSESRAEPSRGDVRDARAVFTEHESGWLVFGEGGGGRTAAATRPEEGGWQSE